MARVILVQMVVIEGEIHFAGDFCWCGSHYDEMSGIFLHQLAMEVGKTHPNTTEMVQ